MPEKIAPSHRIKIDAVGFRKTDAASYALRVLGMMLQEAHYNGHSCGGENGSATGQWEVVGSHEPKGN
jgi:hypothetical protein